MAVQRLALSTIFTEVLRILGYSASTAAPWATDAALATVINRVGQALPGKITEKARAMGKVPAHQRAALDMWLTKANLTATSGSSNVHFATDYDMAQSFYDDTANRRVEVVRAVDRWHIKKLRDKPAGPPEAIEITGFVTNGSDWVRRGVLYPATLTGVTPVISCTYWRLPATMPNSSPTTEYPDADYKWHEYWIAATVVELARNSGQEFDRYRAIEDALLTDMAAAAVPVAE